MLLLGSLGWDGDVKDVVKGGEGGAGGEEEGVKGLLPSGSLVQQLNASPGTALDLHPSTYPCEHTEQERAEYVSMLACSMAGLALASLALTLSCVFTT